MSVHNRTRRAARPAKRTHAAANSKRDAITANYPVPPVYADDNEPQSSQPACYASPPRIKRALTDTERAIQSRKRYPEVMRGRG